MIGQCISNKYMKNLIIGQTYKIENINFSLISNQKYLKIIFPEDNIETYYIIKDTEINKYFITNSELRKQKINKINGNRR